MHNCCTAAPAANNSASRGRPLQQYKYRFMTRFCCDAQGDEEPAVAFCFGEAATQLLLTKGEVRALTVETMAEIWKVRWFSLRAQDKLLNSCSKCK